MRCDRARELLPDLVGGELGLKDRGRLWLHLLGCRDCRREAEELRKVIEGLKALRVRERVRVELPGIEAEERGSPWRLAPVAVALALLVLWMVWPRTPPADEAPYLPPWELEEVVSEIPEEQWQQFLALSFGEGWKETLPDFMEGYLDEITWEGG